MNLNPVEKTKEMVQAGINAPRKVAEETLNQAREAVKSSGSIRGDLKGLANTYAGIGTAPFKACMALVADRSLTKAAKEASAVLTNTVKAPLKMGALGVTSAKAIARQPIKVAGSIIKTPLYVAKFLNNGFNRLLALADHLGPSATPPPQAEQGSAPTGGPQESAHPPAPEAEKPKSATDKLMPGIKEAPDTGEPEAPDPSRNEAATMAEPTKKEA